MMRELMNVTRALADENRIRILGALRGGELCVCQVVMLLGLAPSTVSKHLAILRSARLIEARKDGRWVYYTLSGRDAPLEARSALKWLAAQLESEPQAQADERELKRILRMEPEVLCRVMCETRQPAIASVRTKE